MKTIVGAIMVVMLYAPLANAFTADGMIVLTRRLYDVTETTNIVINHGAKKIPVLVNLYGADDTPYPLDGRQARLVIAHREYPYIAAQIQDMSIVQPSSVYALMTLNVPPGVYAMRVRVNESSTTNVVAEFCWQDILTVADAPSLSITNDTVINLNATTTINFASGFVQANFTNNVVLSNISNTTQVIFSGPLTSTDGTVRIHGNQLDGYDIGVIGGPGGGSSGSLAVYDYSGGVVRAATTGVQFSANFSVYTNELGVFIDRTDMGGFPTNFSGTNITTYAPNWSSATPTQLYHVCSATTTQVTLHVWGAGANWPGGYTVVWLAHPSALMLKTLTIDVGQGGYASSNSVAGTLYEVPGGWPDGGAALVRSNAVGVSGGGSSRVWDGTNLVAVGGGGGNAYNAAGPAYGSGGGITAGPLAPSASNGQGGTQTNGGAVATTMHATYARTNSAGGYLTAGRPGWATNVTSSVWCDGAGGGYYGGGGGLANAAQAAGGGGGGGWWNPALAYIYGGDTSRGSQTYPPKTEYEHYITGRGQAIAARAHGTWGGHGLVIVEER